MPCNTMPHRMLVHSKAKQHAIAHAATTIPYLTPSYRIAPHNSTRRRVIPRYRIAWHSMVANMTGLGALACSAQFHAHGAFASTNVAPLPHTVGHGLQGGVLRQPAFHEQALPKKLTTNPLTSTTRLQMRTRLPSWGRPRTTCTSARHVLIHGSA